MSKHTPGPWEMAGPVGKAMWIRSKAQPNIAGVHFAYTEEGVANAALIAAAPDLLAAAKQLLADMQPFMQQKPSKGMALRALMDAVEKAEGKDGQ